MKRPTWISMILFASVLFAAGITRAADYHDHAHHGHGDAAKKVEKPNIFGWDNPTGVMFQLKLLDNAQLLLVDRDDKDKKYVPVWQTILVRPGIESKLRSEAVAALVKLEKADTTAVLVKGIENAANEENAEPVINELTGLLARQPKVDLAKHTDTFAELAEADGAAIQRAAYIGLIAGGGKADELWEQAEIASSGFAPLLHAIAATPSKSARLNFAGKVIPLLESGNEPAVTQAAMLAAAAMDGQEAKVFPLLADAVIDDTERATALQAMLRLPVSTWPKESSAKLARHIEQSAGKVPVEQRTDAWFVDMVSVGEKLAKVLPAKQTAGLSKTLKAVGVRIVRIKTVYEQMRYDVKFFAAEAGRPVQIVLDNVDVMPHNIVIVKPGSMQKVGEAASLMQPPKDPKVKPFIPDMPEVLHAGHLVQSNEVGRLSFIAPTEPGEYPYVCTFPGHWMKMYGVMVVVKDLEAWEKAPTTPMDPIDPTKPIRDVVQEYTLKSALTALEGVHRKPSFEKGQTLFKQMSCALCHKMNGKGGNVGPDLTEVFKKHKNNRESLLVELIDPSKVVDEKFKAYLVETEEGDQHYGVITKETDEAIWIVTNPQNPVPLKIAVSDIYEKRAAKGSMMPKGLLNFYYPDDLFDLLHYLEAGGNPKHAVYNR